MEPRRFPVAEGAAGTRLDAFLARALGASRAEVRRVLARGVVRVDGRACSAAEKGVALAPGAVVEVARFVPAAAQRPVPEPELALPVLAEGPGWLVVDKPAGMPVHPLREEERGSALGSVAARHPEIVGVGEGGLRSGVAHRLDIETSGCLAFATEEASWQRLREEFRRHRMEKVYRAVALGRLEGEGTLELELVVARHRPALVRAAPGGHPVALAWHALEALAGATLVEVRPVTGFLHQIRAGLAHLGHPLAGDVRYGAAEAGDPSGATRAMLHASRLAGAGLAAEAPDPADFAAVLARLRPRAPAR
jgi:23S rRNA pseudouridine1911/1915/1917 synthase